MPLLGNPTRMLQANEGGWLTSTGDLDTAGRFGDFNHVETVVLTQFLDNEFVFITLYKGGIFGSSTKYGSLLLVAAFFDVQSGTVVRRGTASVVISRPDKPSNDNQQFWRLGGSSAVDQQPTLLHRRLNGDQILLVVNGSNLENLYQSVAVVLRFDGTFGAQATIMREEVNATSGSNAERSYLLDQQVGAFEVRCNSDAGSSSTGLSGANRPMRTELVPTSTTNKLIYSSWTTEARSRAQMLSGSTRRHSLVSRVITVHPTTGAITALGQWKSLRDLVEGQSMGNSFNQGVVATVQELGGAALVQGTSILLSQYGLYAMTAAGADAVLVATRDLQGSESIYPMPVALMKVDGSTFEVIHTEDAAGFGMNFTWDGSTFGRSANTTFSLDGVPATENRFRTQTKQPTPKDGQAFFPSPQLGPGGTGRPLLRGHFYDVNTKLSKAVTFRLFPDYADGDVFAGVYSPQVVALTGDTWVYLWFGANFDSVSGVRTQSNAWWAQAFRFGGRRATSVGAQANEIAFSTYRRPF